MVWFLSTIQLLFSLLFFLSRLIIGCANEFLSLSWNTTRHFRQHALHSHIRYYCIMSYPCMFIWSMQVKKLETFEELFFKDPIYTGARVLYHIENHCLLYSVSIKALVVHVIWLMTLRLRLTLATVWINSTGIWYGMMYSYLRQLQSARYYYKQLYNITALSKDVQRFWLCCCDHDVWLTQLYSNCTLTTAVNFMSVFLPVGCHCLLHNILFKFPLFPIPFARIDLELLVLCDVMQVSVNM